MEYLVLAKHAEVPLVTCVFTTDSPRDMLQLLNRKHPVYTLAYVKYMDVKHFEPLYHYLKETCKEHTFGFYCSVEHIVDVLPMEGDVWNEY